MKYRRKSPILKATFLTILLITFTQCLTDLTRGLLVTDPEEVYEPGPVGEQRHEDADQRGEDEAGRPPGQAHLQEGQTEVQREASHEVNNPGYHIKREVRRGATCAV